MYLTQKRPSLTTIENLFRNSMNINIRKNKQRKLREILKIVDGPMQSNCLIYYRDTLRSCRGRSAMKNTL